MRKTGSSSHTPTDLLFLVAFAGLAAFTLQHSMVDRTYWFPERPCAFSSDSRTLLLIVGSPFHATRLVAYDLEAREPLWMADLPRVLAARYSGDGRRVEVLGMDTLAFRRSQHSWYETPTVHVLDARTGTLLRAPPSPDAASLLEQQFQAPTVSIDAPDGRTRCTMDDDGYGARLLDRDDSPVRIVLRSLTSGGHAEGAITLVFGSVFLLLVHAFLRKHIAGDYFYVGVMHAVLTTCLWLHAFQVPAGSNVRFLLEPFLTLVLAISGTGFLIGALSRRERERARQRRGRLYHVLAVLGLLSPLPLGVFLLHLASDLKGFNLAR